MNKDNRNDEADSASNEEKMQSNQELQSENNTPVEQDDDWQSLVDSWQSIHPQLPELKKNLRFRAKRALFLNSLDLFMAPLMMAFFAYHLMNYEHLYEVFILSAVILFTPYVAYFSIKNRWGLWKIENKNSREIVELQVKHSQAGLRAAQFTKKIVKISLPFILVLISFQMISEPERYFTLTNFLLVKKVSAFIWLAVCWYLSNWYIAKKQKELTNLDEVLSEMDGDNS